MAGIYRSIDTIGTALNDRSAAQALNARLQASAARIIGKQDNRPKPTVFFPIWYDPVIVAGKHAFITELIAMAGGASVTADLNQDWPQISIESIVRKQPALLMLKRPSQMDPAKLIGLPGWKELNCVQRHRAVYVDDRIELPSPVAFDALEDLAKQFDAFR